MRWYHPNLNLNQTYVVVCAIALASALGCQNQQTVSLSNPFLGQDRVPPPSTRVITPGTAQPYYPGDPLPAMQSGAAPAAAPVATNPPAPPATDLASTEPRLNFAAGHESPVGVPTDTDDLRYALPNPIPPTPAPAPPSVPQVAAAPAASPVQQAAYNEPVPNSYVEAPGFTAPVEIWRSPEVPPPEPAPYEPQPFAAAAPQPIAYAARPPITPVGAQQYAPIAQPPITPIGAQESASWVQEPITPVGAQSFAPMVQQPIMPMPAAQPAVQQPATIPVRLRTVPSAPQPEPVMPSAPRIRMPSQVSASMVPTMGPGGQQAIYYAPAFPPGTVVQTVRVTELPSYGPMVPQAEPTLAMNPSMGSQNAAPQPAAIAAVSRDGFRPRGSAR